MPEIAWAALEEALKNQEACDRYQNGYRADKKTKSEIDLACASLQAEINKGKVYGCSRNVSEL